MKTCLTYLYLPDQFLIHFPRVNDKKKEELGYNSSVLVPYIFQLLWRKNQIKTRKKFTLCEKRRNYINTTLMNRANDIDR